MGFGPNTNLAAIGAISGVNVAGNSLNKTLARLATAKRINSAADDAAGLALATNIGAQAEGLSVSMRNINDGLAMVRTAESGAGEVGNLLGRMRELAVQSSSGTLNDVQRAYIQDEFSALSQEVDRISGSTSFNGRGLLDGSTGTVAMQVGEDGSANSQLDVAFGDASMGTLGLGATSLATQGGAQAAIADIDAAMQSVNRLRSSLGASDNALDSAFAAADGRHQALLAAESNLLDADMAQESANLARDQILQDVSLAVQAQANRFAAYSSNLIG